MTGVLPAEPHVELVRCHVHYMGRGALAEVPDGLMAIQRPLLELFHSAGISGSLSTTLTVFTSGVLAESPELNPGDKWWPIQDLLECGAFRVVGSDVIPVEVVDSKHRKSHSHGPALFAMAFHRQDIPAADTWGFVTQSDETSMALVVAIRRAYANRAGWGSSRSDRPSRAASSQSSRALQLLPPGPASDSSMFHATAAAAAGGDKFHSGYSGRGSAIVRSGLLEDKHVPKAYYDKPPLNGYFYTPSSSLIQKYSVSEKQTEVVPVPQPPQEPPQPPPQQPPQQPTPTAHQPGVFYGETDFIFLQPQSSYMPANYDQQFASDNYPFAYGVDPPHTTGYLVPQRPMPKDKTIDKKQHGIKEKKKGKKNQRTGSDDDGETSSVAVFTRENGSRVVVIPENISIVVRPPRQKAPGPFDQQDAMGQNGITNAYIDPSNPQYERRIVPGSGGFGGPEVDLDPFIDEGPYEWRLPVGGYGVQPDSRNPGPNYFPGQPQDLPEQFADEGPYAWRIPVGRYGLESGYNKPDSGNPGPRNVTGQPGNGYDPGYQKSDQRNPGPSNVTGQSGYEDYPGYRKGDQRNPGPRNVTGQPQDFQDPWFWADGPMESNFILRESDRYGRAPPLPF